LGSAGLGCVTGGCAAGGDGIRLAAALAAALLADACRSTRAAVIRDISDLRSSTTGNAGALPVMVLRLPMVAWAPCPPWSSVDAALLP
jgi:hypothetical protein